MIRFIILLTIFFNSNVYAKCKVAHDTTEDYKNYFNLNNNNLHGAYKEIDKILVNSDNYYYNYVKGYMYLTGKNKLKNISIAEKYLLLSANYCFSPAHYSLGYLYLNNGDLKLAKKWFDSAKKIGDNLAAHQLAIMYRDEKNPEKMMENLNYSANNNFLPSITELGVQYYDGFLVSKDLNKAFKYFERAANMNDSLAQNNLACMYENGEGTYKNLEQAKYWYKISSENGFELASENLMKLNKSNQKDHKIYH